MSLDHRLRHGLRATARTAEVDPDGDVAAGRTRVERRRRRARLLTGAAVVVLVLAAAVTAAQVADDGDPDGSVVGTGGEPPPSPPSRPAPTAAPGDEAPPPVRVTAGDRSLELDAFTFCYSTMCAYGTPPDPLPDIGAAGELRVDFALTDWTLDAELRTAGQECGRSESVELELPRRRGPATSCARRARPAPTT